MSFLEEAIVKTKEVFDVACKKTGEVVAVEKQKFGITSLKSKREKDYAELGRMYYEMAQNEDDLPDEVINLINAISEKNNEIDRLNEEINNIKNKLVCPNCGAGVEKNSVYCNSCGEKIVSD